MNIGFHARVSTMHDTHSCVSTLQQIAGHHCSVIARSVFPCASCFRMIHDT